MQWTVELAVSDRWFRAVEQGLKQYEGRRWTLKIAHLKPGDTLVFRHLDNQNRTVKRAVKGVHLFQTFEQALLCLPLDKVLPGVETIEEGIAIYCKFVTLETQKKDGVCMIQLEQPAVPHNTPI